MFISHLVSPLLKLKVPFLLGHVQIPARQRGSAQAVRIHSPVLCALSTEAAVNPSPAPQLERKPRPGPCRPPGPAHGSLSWKPSVSEESRGLGPGSGRPSVAGDLVAPPSPQVARSPVAQGWAGSQRLHSYPAALPEAQLLPAGRAGQNPGAQCGESLFFTSFWALWGHR